MGWGFVFSLPVLGRTLRNGRKKTNPHPIYGIQGLTLVWNDGVG